jgi:hypothetical protein
MIEGEGGREPTLYKALSYKLYFAQETKTREVFENKRRILWLTLLIRMRHKNLSFMIRLADGHKYATKTQLMDIGVLNLSRIKKRGTGQ